MSGVLNGNYKHGRYSKDLPTQLAVRASEARTNPQLLSVADDIAVLEARLARLLSQVETGESGAAWQELQEALDAFSAAQASGDLGAMDVHFARLGQIVRRGAAASGAWQEALQVFGERRKQVQTEVKTLQTLQQMITVQQHTLMLGAILSTVTEGVQRYADAASGKAILQHIMGEFTRLSTLEEAR